MDGIGANVDENKANLSEAEIEAALQRAADQLSDELIEAASQKSFTTSTKVESPPQKKAVVHQERQGAPTTNQPTRRPAPVPPLADRTRIAKQSQVALRQAPKPALQEFVGNEPHVYVRGTPALRFMGVVLMIGGLVTALWMPLVGYIIAGVGAMTFLLGFIGKRRLGSATNPNLTGDIPKLRRQIAFWKVSMVLGVAIALIALGFTFFEAARPYLFATAAGALMFAAIGYMRMPVLLRSLVQATVIAHSAGGQDPRLARVLHALDALLGTIPESALRKFSVMEESEMYLEILDALEDK